MNRKFLAVIAGGFGTGSSGGAAIYEGEDRQSATDTAESLKNADSVIIV